MMKRHINIFLIAFVIFFLPINLCADVNSIRVKVVVSGMEDLENIIASNIKKELVSLSDVVVVDDNAEYLISLVAGEIAFINRRTAGVALSVVLMEHFDNSFIADIIQDDKKSAVQSETSNLYKFKGHWFQVGAYKAIMTLCAEIVADINSHHFEGKRKSSQKDKKE
jgi:hypothetical protein